MTSIESKYTSSMTIGKDFDLYRSPNAPHAPEISVIVSTYNRSRSENDCESLLKRAIDSILNQTFTNFELILMDDCSKDNTLEVCKEIAAKDARVTFIHFKKNSGFPAKRYNYGMGISRGKYVTFMFDDDQWELNALADLHQAIENLPDHYGMVYGLATCYVGSDRKNPVTLGSKWGWAKLFLHNFISNNSVIVKRSAIDLVGGYDEDPIFIRNCDWDLWWRIGRKFKVGRIERRVGIVFSDLPDSLACTKTMDWGACRSRQKTARQVPLQIATKEPLRCKLQATIFDLYESLVFRSRQLSAKLAIKRRLKNILPASFYLILKKGNAFVKSFLPREN